LSTFEHCRGVLAALILTCGETSFWVTPQVGGLLLVAPEHRASLLLKRDELWEGGDRVVCAELDKLKGMAYLDLVDENDVLLSHK